MSRLEEGLENLPPFIRDTDLNLRFRTFYFDRENPNETQNEAWAIGGWLEYRSGWLADTFAIGAVGYTSQPLHAPDDKDGTTLLAPGQEGITVLGQAYGAPLAALWNQRWRMFWMACAELFGYDAGQQWGVAHYRYTRP